MTIQNTNVSLAAYNTEVNAGLTLQETAKPLGFDNIGMRALAQVDGTGPFSFSDLRLKSTLTRGIPSAGGTVGRYYTVTPDTPWTYAGFNQEGVSVGALNGQYTLAVGGPAYTYDAVNQTIPTFYSQQAGISYSTDMGRNWVNVAFPSISGNPEFGEFKLIYLTDGNWYALFQTRVVTGYGMYGGYYYGYTNCVYRSSDLTNWTDLSWYFPITDGSLLDVTKFYAKTNDRNYVLWDTELTGSARTIVYTNNFTSFQTSTVNYPTGSWGPVAEPPMAYNAASSLWVKLKSYGSGPGRRSLVIYSTNGGLNWSSTDLPYNATNPSDYWYPSMSQYSNMFVMSNGYMLLQAWSYRTNQIMVYRSSDGANWTYSLLTCPLDSYGSTPNNGCAGLTVLDSGVVVCLGWNGGLWTSTDDGATWTDRSGTAPWGYNTAYINNNALSYTGYYLNHKRYITVTANDQRGAPYFGNFAAYYVSSNGVNWTQIGTTVGPPSNSIIKNRGVTASGPTSVRGTIITMGIIPSTGVRTIFYG
jgi:hypothetical protein